MRISTLSKAAALALTLAAILLAAACGRPAARDAAPDGLSAAAPATVYHCPMHPQVTSDKPGSCPICGMDLVPSEPEATHEAHQAGEVSGRATLDLTSERRQALGVRSEPVMRTLLERRIRTVARIAVDERRLRHVHTKFEGYVEKLYVDFTGARVRKGDPLLSIYSPELVATQQEYLLALRAQRRLGQSPVGDVARGSADLVAAARERLSLWDVAASDIERLEATGEAVRDLDLHAEIGGYVVQKNVFEGMRVTPQDTLFDIADLSHLWVLADVYESDLPAVRLGMPGDVSVSYLPGRSWRGPVTYIAPTVDPKTRTIEVRLEVENSGERLKPDMYADVELRASLGEGLLLPESAVLDSGDRQLVFVDQGEGRYQPREVGLGSRVDGGFQVLSGVLEGERVVVSASFLIDSESSLRAALAGMSPAPSAGHQH